MTVVRIPRRGVRFLIRFALAVFVAVQLYCGAFLLPDSMLPPVEDYRSSSLFEPAPAPAVVPLEATGYCACPICCGKWADGRTASGTRATEGRTIAADPALFASGTCLAFDFGHRIVEDTGSAILGWRVDVYFDTHQAALEFGRQFVSWGVC